MKLKHYKKDALEYIVVDDIYSEHELSLIKQELNSLIPYLKSVEEVKSDHYENDVTSYKKNCPSLWVDDYYIEDRSRSNILTFNRKLFGDDIVSFAMNVNSFYGHLKYCNMDTTLLNFYQNTQHYKSHRDKTVISALTLFKIGNIQGGGLIFTKNDAKVDFKDNRMIIFPGCVYHETELITTTPNSYRVSMAQFISYKE